MFSGVLQLILVSQAELTTGKLLQILEQKINSKLVSQEVRTSRWIVLSVTILLAMDSMVQSLFYLGLGQLRNGSNAAGSNYGKRFKKSGVLGICLDMTKGTLSFALDN